MLQHRRTSSDGIRPTVTERAKQEPRAEIDRVIDHSLIPLGILNAGVRQSGESARGICKC